MNYLVSNNVFALNNGPEYASYERLAALNSNHLSTKLLLKDFSNTLTNAINDHHINHDDVINMYDYFQGIVHEANQPLNVHYLPSFPFETYHLKGLDNNKAAFEYYGNRKGMVNFMPGQVTKVGSIDYYDRLGHLVCTEIWDTRGFPSRLDSYHLDGSVGTSRYLRRDGSTAILETRMNIQGQVRPTMWKLMNYKGQNWQFDTEDDLFTFFLNEINQQEKGTFITDRRIMDKFALAVHDPVSTVAVMHSIPVKNVKHANTSRLNELADGLFDPHRQQPVHFKHIVFPTAEERDVFKQRFGQNVPNTEFDVADDCYVNVKVDKHEKQAIVPILGYRGMLGSTKHTDDLIRAFNDYSKTDSLARLKLQGYFESQDQEKNLKDMVGRLGLTNRVQFIPYKPFDQDFFQDVSVFVNPTRGEAFGMNALEAMASGVPVISANIPYLANNLVQDGVNGILVKQQTPRALAQATQALLHDDNLYQTLSQGALKTGREFNKDAYVKSWQGVLN